MSFLTSKVTRIYEVVAFNTFNIIVLIILVNLILAGLFFVRDSFGEKEPSIDRRVIRERGPYNLVAYSRLSASEVHAFLDEQEVFNSIGFLYEPWVQFRSPEFHGRWLNTDSQGIRRTKARRSSDNTPLKIFVFGGSTTFGYGVPDDYTIPSYIQTILEDRYPQRSIVVNNYAQGYYYSSQELQQFLSLLKKQIIPDHAIFIDGLNEVGRIHYNNETFGYDEPYFAAEVRRLWDARGGVSSKHEDADGFMDSSENFVALARNLRASIPMVRLSKSIVSRFLSHSEPGKIEGKGFDQQPALPLSDSEVENMASTVESIYKANVAILQAVCRKYGVKCYFVWQPIPWYKYDRTLFRPMLVEPYWAKVYSSMETVHLQNFLYLGNMLERVKEKVFVDQVHYNERINEEIARRICDFLALDSRA